MNVERYNALMRDCTGPCELQLTPEEIAEGWHFCGEWDGLLVDWHDNEGEGEFCHPNCGSGMNEADYEKKKKELAEMPSRDDGPVEDIDL